MALGKSARPWLVPAFSLLSACTVVGPDFVQPSAPVNEAWSEPDQQHFVVDAQSAAEWWRLFDDPVLVELVELTHERNNNLKLAGLRVLEAQANLGIATGSRYPQVQVLTGQALAIGTSESDENTLIDDLDFRKYNVGAAVAWELDFWGRFKRGIEAADAALLASAAGYDELFILLTAGIAEVYTLFRTLEEQLAVTTENLTNQQRSFEIVSVLFENGESSELDVIQAQTLLLSTQAAVPELDKGLRQARNAMSSLLGMPPSDLADVLKAGVIPKTPEQLSVGVPGDLLRQRPDVRRAEYLARAQNAAVGLAKANLYPSFSIGGTVGLSSSDSGGSSRSGDSGLGALFDTGSFSYAVGPSFVWPFLNYGRIKNSVRVQDARLQQALIAYRETVIQAAREVEDAMAAYTNALKQNEILRDTVAAAKRATELSMLRYKEGLADYQRVLTAQQALFAQQARFVGNRGEIVRSLIAVYKALGGGWQTHVGPAIDDETAKTMRERTDWGELIDTLDQTPD